MVTRGRYPPEIAVELDLAEGSRRPPLIRASLWSEPPPGKLPDQIPLASGEVRLPKARTAIACELTGRVGYDRNATLTLAFDVQPWSEKPAPAPAPAAIEPEL